MTPALILAGGQARRMGGGDKCLLPLAGRPLLDHILDRLAPQAAPVWLSANGDATRFAPWGLEVLPDSLPDHPGPLAGILAGLDHAAQAGFDALLCVAGDTPFLPPDLAARLAAAGPLALAASQEGTRVHRQPTIGLWPTALRGALRAALDGGLRKIVAFTDDHGAGQAIWPDDPFFNINTPDDLARAEARLDSLS